MRVYLSGPISNKPNHNVAAFDAAAKLLRGEGHFVINPHDLTPIFGTVDEVAKSFRSLYGERRFGSPVPSADLAQSVMDADLAAVRSCDAIYLLRGWDTSRGARKELAEALAHGLTVVQEGAAQ